jgi:hypothetical protein
MQGILDRLEELVWRASIFLKYIGFAAAMYRSGAPRAANRREARNRLSRSCQDGAWSPRLVGRRRRKRSRTACLVTPLWYTALNRKRLSY